MLVAFEFLDDALGETGQHLAGADLEDIGDAVGGHVGDAFAPAHRAGDLLDEALLDLFGIADRRGEHVGDDGHDRRLDGDVGQRLAPSRRRRVASARNGRGRRPAAAPRGARRCALPISGTRSSAVLCARQHDLRRLVVVGDLADVALGSCFGHLASRHRCRRRAAPSWRPGRPARQPAWPCRAASGGAQRRRARRRRRPRAPNIRPANGRRRT